MNIERRKSEIESRNGGGGRNELGEVSWNNVVWGFYVRRGVFEGENKKESFEL